MNILIGVSGSISSYKAYDLCREFLKLGHSVKVVLTKGAENFIKKETFNFLGASDSYGYNDDFNLEKYKSNESVLHIELSRWADKFIIYPLSANTLSKISHGFAEDLLQSIFLAYPKDKPIVLFPAMNSKMLHHPFIEENIKKLKSLPNLFIHSTKEGELICGEVGDGKLIDTEVARDFTLTFTKSSKNKKILITTGATKAYLDPVRYLTNPSTGLTGYEFSKYFLERGYKVTCIAGTSSLKSLDNLKENPNFTLFRVSTTKEMHDLVMENIEDKDLFISSAAVCDISFKESETKIKKEDLLDNLPIKQDIDILKSVLSLKKENLLTVGFAAETELTKKVLEEKWMRKKTNLLIGNEVDNGSDLKGFGATINKFIFYKENSIKELTHLTKRELAQKIEVELDLK